MRLLERTRPRLASREGQMLYDLARPLIEGMESLDQQFRTQRQGLDAGEVTIAAGASTLQYLLPALVRDFREQCPDVRLQLANATGKDGLALLRSDQVDFAFGSMLDVPHDLSYEPVQWFDPMLILPLEHPLAEKKEVLLEDLSPFGLILPPQRLTTYRLVDLVFQQRRVPYRVAIEVGGWEVIKQYVAIGLGISIVTRICMTDQIRGQLAVRNMRRFFRSAATGLWCARGNIFLRRRAFHRSHQAGVVCAGLLRVGAFRALIARNQVLKQFQFRNSIPISVNASARFRSHPASWLPRAELPCRYAARYFFSCKKLQKPR